MTNAINKITGGASLVACIATFVLGIVHIVKYKYSLKWPSKSFINEDNALLWRRMLLADIFTPLIFGIVGILAHETSMNTLRRYLNNPAYNLGFLIIMLLFANIGYNSVLGLIVAIITGFAIIMNIVLLCVKPKSTLLFDFPIFKNIQNM